MAGAVKIRDAAGAVQALREPLVAALDGAAAALAAQGVPRDQALAWAASELLAVVADVLSADVPRAADGDPFDENQPFDMSDTSRHQQIERDLTAAAARLEGVGLGQPMATTAAASLCLESIAGILAGMARAAIRDQG